MALAASEPSTAGICTLGMTRGNGLDGLHPAAPCHCTVAPVHSLALAYNAFLLVCKKLLHFLVHF